MKLYNFGEWNKEKRTIQFTEWETDEVLFKKELQKIKKGWVVLDVGSEYGYYAIKAGLFAGSEGKVLAIECHPETYQLLKMNIELHKLRNRVVPICKAIGKEVGKTRLYETISPGSTSIIPPRSIFKMNRSRLKMLIEFVRQFTILKIIRKKFVPVGYDMPLVTIDRITKEYDLERVDLIKIDIEGAELDALRGATVTLTKNKPILLIEVHFGCGWKPETLYELLCRLGYDLTVEKRILKAHVVACPK